MLVTGWYLQGASAEPVGAAAAAWAPRDSRRHPTRPIRIRNH